MSKPKDISEAVARARKYGTPTYMMLADEIEQLKKEKSHMALDALASEGQWMEKSDKAQTLIEHIANQPVKHPEQPRALCRAYLKAEEDEDDFTRAGFTKGELIWGVVLGVIALGILIFKVLP